MNYPSKDDDLAKDAMVAWVTDMFDGDEFVARRTLKLQLLVRELYERGFRWTDI